MGRTTVTFYQEAPGDVPVLDWLKALRKQDTQAWANCSTRIEQLAEHGNDLRRPAADYLDDGIYELRARHGNVQYRILYFFQGRGVAILGHSFVKSGSAVNPNDLAVARRRKGRFLEDPEKRSYQGDG